MKTEFVSKIKGNHKLILIYAGWSTDVEFYRHIYRPGWDVLVVWDYTTLDFDKSLLDDYTTIYLYAWSLGVFAACRTLQDVRLGAAFAINGTRTPIDDVNGIPKSIYKGTADNLSEDNLKRFQRRMFISSQEYESMKHLLPSRNDIENLVKQLETVKKTAAEPQTEKIRWTRVYISVNDLIFPYRNQINSWSGVAQPNLLHTHGHYVNLGEIIKETIPDLTKIGIKFKQSASTYDNNAIAQRKVSIQLTRMIADHGPKPHCKTLEVGAGTGIFTRMYAPVLCPREAGFVDLYPTPTFGVAPVESHAVADAEEAFETTPHSMKWDYILSANTIQWFRDPVRFFHNAWNYLEPGGWLICSTFVRGTLKELDPLRPSPVIYRDKYELKKGLEQKFFTVIVKEEEIRVTFRTAKEALLHLKYTGVNPQSSKVSLSNLLSAIPQDEEGNYYLTYRPLYLLAKKM